MSERFDDGPFYHTLEGSFQLESIPQVDPEKLDLVEKAAIERAITEREELVQRVQIDTLELRSERNALRNQLATLETERDHLRGRLQELEAERPTLEPRAVVSSLGTALETADENLSDARYRVSDIDVILKANVIQTADGMRMHLPSLDEQTASANLSEFAFRFKAAPDEEERSGTDYVEIPDVVGRPEAAATQRLRSAKLTVGTVETVTDPNVAPGTVLEQFPEPLVVAPPESSVDLVVAELPDEEPDEGNETGEVEESDGQTVDEEEVVADEDTPDTDDGESDGTDSEIDKPDRDTETVLLERLRRAGIEDIEALGEQDPEKIADLLGASVEDVTELLEQLTDATQDREAIDLEQIDGIGPTYAGRLREAGISDVSTLMGIDAKEAAEITNASVSQTEQWMEQAHELVEKR